ncbi:2-oxoacid:acceptor oxidoreductase family protein [bacterium]|nr:2-oxoacid:acceptor oxidoreductase family protein [bacterium]
MAAREVLVASDILSNVALLAGFDIKKSEAHCMAQRGGSVVSHVCFGEKIYSPLVTKGEANFLLAFEKLESWRYLDYLHRDGTVLVNNQEINPMTVVTSGAQYPENVA